MNAMLRKSNDAIARYTLDDSPDDNDDDNPQDHLHTFPAGNIGR